MGRINLYGYLQILIDRLAQQKGEIKSSQLNQFSTKTFFP